MARLGLMTGEVNLCIKSLSQPKRGDNLGIFFIAFGLNSRVVSIGEAWHPVAAGTVCGLCCREFC